MSHFYSSEQLKNSKIFEISKETLITLKNFYKNIPYDEI